MSVRKSVVLSALDSYLGLMLQLASTVILARMLTPEQTGVFAVAAVFAALASNFRDFGVGEYLIQEKELTDDAIRASLTVNIAVSWLMAACLLGLSPLAARFYNEPGVGAVMRVQALNFLLIPFGAVTMAWFRRELNFRPIVLAGIAANSASFVTAVSLAFAGFGYMSLAWSSLVGVIVTVSAALWMRPAHFPRWPGRRGLRKVLEFGKFASGVYIFGQLGKGAPEMILGRVVGMAGVGMFSRAWGLVEIFHRLVLRTVSYVVLPYFAQATREHGTPRKAVVQSIQMVCGLGLPFLAFMAVAADPAVRLMYGTQWLQAVPLAKVLCVVAMVELVYYTAKEALLAQGMAKQGNSLQMGMQAVRVCGLLAAIPWGLPGACWGLLVAAAVGAMLSHRSLARNAGLTLAEVWGALRPCLWLTLATAGPMALATWIWPITPANSIPYGVAGGACAVLGWCVVLRKLEHPLWPELRRLLAAVLKRVSGNKGKG